MYGERQLQEIIESDEVICSISCRYGDLEHILREKNCTELLDLVSERPHDATSALYPFKDYNKGLVKMAKLIIESDSYCNSRELYELSNDCRPYKLWIESLEKVLKSYSDVSPMEIAEVIKDDYKVLYWDSNTQDLLTMPMRGKLFDMLRVYRASTLTEVFKSQGRCVMTEFVSFMENIKREEEQAEKDWKDV